MGDLSLTSCNYEKKQENIFLSLLGEKMKACLMTLLVLAFFTAQASSFNWLQSFPSFNEHSVATKPRLSTKEGSRFNSFLKKSSQRVSFASCRDYGEPCSNEAVCCEFSPKFGFAIACLISEDYKTK